MRTGNISAKALVHRIVFPGLFAAGVAIVYSSKDVSRRPHTFCDSQFGAKDFGAVRGILGMMQTINTDAFLMNAQAAYQAVARADGTLTMVEMDQAVQLLSAKIVAQQFFKVTPPEPMLRELGTLLFRVLDADHDGTVTLKEFLMGQALIYSAAKSKSSLELGELCWRFLDADGNGTIDRAELREALRVMILFGCINARDRSVGTGTYYKSNTLLAGKGSLGVRERKRSKTVEQLTDYYMEVYDTDHNGKISKAEFGIKGPLQENFWNLMVDPSAKGMFMVQVDNFLIEGGVTRGDVPLR